MSEISLDGMVAIFSKKFMTQPLSDSFASPTFNQFIAPLYELQQAAKNQYRCHVVTDEEWIRSGLQRVIGQHDSGCHFVQKRVLRGVMNLTKSNSFTFKLPI